MFELVHAANNILVSEPDPLHVQGSGSETNNICTMYYNSFTEIVPTTPREGLVTSN